LVISVVSDSVLVLVFFSFISIFVTNCYLD
jgi:hypothetical protein